MLRIVRAVLIFILGAASFAIAAQPPRSPYTGEQNREIKALSSQEVESYLSGRGMGLAKAAELNRYPGPAHVLELADQLGLSAEQKARTRALFNLMETKAKDLGKTLVEEETRLDRLFASRQISREQLTSSLAEIARLQGELRQVHLEAHLAQTELLAHEQIAKYVELRGYDAAEHPGGDADSHRH